MNEVYVRGGLSSYALFLLVLTIVRQHQFKSNEDVGQYLIQFLRQFGSLAAFKDIIRPLHGYIEKQQWDDPFTLCIQDPVNEENYIGRQTFSIREIQYEWQLSFNALTAAMEDYTGGSVLASIVGLTTR
jgi:DNA polymerase sigma